MTYFEMYKKLTQVMQCVDQDVAEPVYDSILETMDLLWYRLTDEEKEELNK
jgi:hypothetical protein